MQKGHGWWWDKTGDKRELNSLVTWYFVPTGKIYLVGCALISPQIDFLYLTSEVRVAVTSRVQD